MCTCVYHIHGKHFSLQTISHESVISYFFKTSRAVRLSTPYLQLMIKYACYAWNICGAKIDATCPCDHLDWFGTCHFTTLFYTLIYTWIFVRSVCAPFLLCRVDQCDHTHHTVIWCPGYNHSVILGYKLISFFDSVRNPKSSQFEIAKKTKGINTCQWWAMLELR